VTIPIKPMFPYFGAKHRIARRYPGPMHDTIVEPFAGSAGYASRYPDRKIVLVDKDPTIAGLWKYLTHVSSPEILSLPLLEPEQAVADLQVPEEAKSLIGFWCNKGSARPQMRTPTTTRSRDYPNQFWGEAMRERVARQVDRVRHWVVIEGSYELAGGGIATFFVDPPYVGRSRVSKRSNGRGPQSVRVGDRYHCGARGLDFAELGEWCKSRQGQVIVCENVGADWLPFRPFVAAKSNNKHRTSEEAVWTNGGHVFGDQTSLAI
jgi:hypothetical protein